MAFAAVRGTQLEVLMLLMALQFGYEDLTMEVGSIEASFSLGADIFRCRSARTIIAAGVSGPGAKAWPGGRWET